MFGRRKVRSRSRGTIGSLSCTLCGVRPDLLGVAYMLPGCTAPHPPACGLAARWREEHACAGRQQGALSPLIMMCGQNAAQRTVRRHFGLCSTDCLGRAHGSAPHPEALFPLLKFSTVGHPVSLLTWPCSESPPPSIAHGRLPRSLYCNACSMAVCPALRLLCVCVRCQLRSRTQAVCHCDH